MNAEIIGIGTELAQIRPYTPGDDVRYLIPVARRLREELVELDRAEWVDEEMSFLEDEAAYRSEPGDAWKRVSGRGTAPTPGTGWGRCVARSGGSVAYRRAMRRLLARWTSMKVR